MYIIWAILGFSLIIIVHELGHFMLAKLNGIKVLEFSIGMGPKIYSYQGKETKYSLGILPIGGYVNMLGEGEESDEEGSFSSKHPLRRLSVVLAGAFMNFVLAMIIFVIIFSKIGFSTPVVSSIEDNMPLKEAGLINGDKIVEVNGSKIHTSSDLSLEISQAKDSTMKIVYERNGEKNEVNVTPVYDEERETYRVGFTYTVIENPTVLQCIKEGANETISLVSQTFKSIGMIFTGKANLKTDVGGPVTIVRMSSQAAKVGVMNLFMLVAILSVSVGIFNLLPFPALDGGWSVLLIIEFITKKKVPDKVVGALNTIGFMILIGIMVLVTIKDILYPINL